MSRRNRKQDNRDRKRRASHDTDLAADFIPPPPPKPVPSWAAEMRKRLEGGEEWRRTSEE